MMQSLRMRKYYHGDMISVSRAFYLEREQRILRGWLFVLIIHDDYLIHARNSTRPRFGSGNWQIGD
jgi:hypothetical protein